MVSMRLTMRAMMGVTLWAGFGMAAQAQLPPVTVEGGCQVMPKQPGVTVTTPAPNQFPQCKVDPIPSKDPKVPMGYVVRDPSGKPVRQFVSYDGKSFNVCAFYVDGTEVYREVYPPQPTDPVQFRWFGSNGTKWGVDRDRDGRIDDWIAISPEELSQEILQAVLARDAKRAEALMLTKANLDFIGLQGPEAQKLLGRTANIAKKVADAAQALAAAPDAKWVQLQLFPPQATPADAIGTREDLVVYKNATILVQDGKNTKFLQIGDLVQIGRAWKLVDGPGGGAAEGSVPGGPIPPEIEAFVQELNKLDQVNPDTLRERTALANYNAKRAEILEQIISKLPADKHETWLRLLVDALSAAAEVEKADGKHITRLKQFKDTLAKGPNPSLAAYAGYRCLIAENNIAIANTTVPAEFSALQDKWRASLEEFVKAYPNSEEAPEATLRLAMAFEYQKDGEPKAKEWYTVLAQRYAKHPHAAKAQGAIKRLESEGKPFELVGPNLANGQPFNTSSLAGNVVLVYYCAGWSQTLPDNAKQLQSLVNQYGPKGLKVVTVCLDNEAAVAAATVQGNKLPGTALFMPGGLDASPLASNYGIMVIPHLFIVGKDGKVVNRNAQFPNLEEELKKLMP
jgi:hypothetical protein